MNYSNAWLDFQLFVELFYMLLDPIGFFNNAQNGALDAIRPPDCPPWCDAGINFWSNRIGMYRRPFEAGEGTGFDFTNPIKGDISTKQQVKVVFRAPFPYTNPHALALNNRAFVMNVDAATGEDVIPWYDYEGTGVQPVIVGNGGPQTYVPIALDHTDEWNSIMIKTKDAIAAEGSWIVLDFEPPPILAEQTFILFEADVVGARIDSTDGRNGYESPVTDMKDSTGAVIASGLTTDKLWEQAHNMTRVPAEEVLGNRVKYIKLVDFECFDCPDKKYANSTGYFLQSPAQPVPWEALRNRGTGVLNNATAGISRIEVVDHP